MDTKALRQKILDLAIRGKLVPQDPNDEPASVLLERIRAEKQQMVKEGKLKAKDIKNDTIIYKGEDNLHYEKFQDGTVKCIEDEIPFEVPEGWAWTRVSSLVQICLGLTHTPD
ncbi:MAG: restriction endonuclease subunit S, partial [Lachnospiraceae bacterium]|nr:restriction endonuclease subunit S [Lachnospiraceae bacterium]